MRLAIVASWTACVLSSLSLGVVAHGLHEQTEPLLRAGLNNNISAEEGSSQAGISHASSLHIPPHGKEHRLGTRIGQQQQRENEKPPAFLWGTATSAYQVEGCVGLQDCGRGPSIWDAFEQQRPSRIADNDSASIAADSVHRYEQDVDLLRRIGVNAYRFSISWSRIFPQGRGHINLEGVNYYNRLIDALIDSGIQPVVTLYHWDMPQALEEEYGGWLNAKVVEDFMNYASLCFERFGDRVKMWITLNEVKYGSNTVTYFKYKY